MTCIPGFEDTNGEFDDGCETQVCFEPPPPNDAQNCGFCGNACASGTCNGNVCAPLTIATGLSATTAYSTAANQDSVYLLARAGTGTLQRLSLDGIAGNVLTISSPASLAICDTRVVWIESGTRVAGASLDLVDVATYVNGSAVWSTSDPMPGVVGCAGPEVFFKSSATVRRLGPPNSGAYAVSATSGSAGSNYRGLTVHGNAVIGINETALRLQTLPTNFIANQVPTAGAENANVPSGNTIGAVDAEGGDLFVAWHTATEGKISRLPLDGGFGSILANADPTNASSRANSMIVDPSGVYWTTNSPSNKVFAMRPGIDAAPVLVRGLGHQVEGLSTSGPYIFFVEDTADQSAKVLQRVEKPFPPPGQGGGGG